MIENIFYPILIDKDLIQFTNIELLNSNDDIYYLVLINNKYQFFKIGFEPDCDGAYFYGHKVNFLEVMQYVNEFKIRECYKSELLKELNKI